MRLLKPKRLRDKSYRKSHQHFPNLNSATAFKKQDRKKFSTIGLDAFIKFAIASSNFNGLNILCNLSHSNFFYLINLRFMLHSRIINDIPEEN